MLQIYIKVSLLFRAMVYYDFQHIKYANLSVSMNRKNLISQILSVLLYHESMGWN